jgi:radical SAM-linked protein
MRVRITFSKTGALRYTGHLDLHKAWERTLRRAGLPLAYSQGYNPRPRINLASALPLGFTSQCEVVDIWFEKEMPQEAIEAAIRTASPPGIRLLESTQVNDSEPALQTQLLASEYRVEYLESFPELEQRVSQILEADTLDRVRRKKKYDLRPLIFELDVGPPDQAGHPTLRMVLSALEGATGRPEEVILEMGGDPILSRVQRTRLIFKQSDNQSP